MFSAGFDDRSVADEKKYEIFPTRWFRQRHSHVESDHVTQIRHWIGPAPSSALQVYGPEEYSRCSSFQIGT